MKDRGPLLAEIHWEGDSRTVISSFPEGVRANLGFALFQLQRGRTPSLGIRRMASIGPGVYELKDSDERSWYRLIYLARIGGVIHVLHAFEKRSAKTEHRDLALALHRLQIVRERLRKLGKHV
jgi:phage-related protein